MVLEDAEEDPEDDDGDLDEDESDFDEEDVRDIMNLLNTEELGRGVEGNAQQVDSASTQQSQQPPPQQQAQENPPAMTGKLTHTV